MLGKYKWFFEFIKDEMLSVAEENPDVLTDNSFGINLYQTTLDLLNGLIDGDITAIDKNAYARTALRQYIHKIININNPNASSGINAYDFIIPSYEDSDVERFEEVLQRVSRLYYSSNDELPVLTLDGYEFEGWFDGEGENANLVTNITCDCHLYARFKEIKYY